MQFTLSELPDRDFHVEAVLFVAVRKHVRNAAPLFVAEQAFECGGVGLANIFENFADRARGV